MERRQTTTTTTTAAAFTPFRASDDADDAEKENNKNKMRRLHDDVLAHPAAAAAHPQINITAESTETTSSWGSIRSPVRSYYPPLTDLERAEYYSNYDPMTGVKIASTLSAFFTMAVLYVVYKAKCKRVRKYFRGSDCTELSPSREQLSFSQHSGGGGVGEQQQQQSWPSLHTMMNSSRGGGGGGGSSGSILCSSSDVVTLMEYGGGGGETPTPTPSTASAIWNYRHHHYRSAMSIKSQCSHHSSYNHQRHYYTDDSEMPPWKIYAKELFLYGPGLWRSAGLKGSDPVLLMATTNNNGENGSNCGDSVSQVGSINRHNSRRHLRHSVNNKNADSRGQLRSGSLSGSMMGRLSFQQRCDAHHRKSSMAYSSQSRLLQVPSTTLGGVAGGDGEKQQTTTTSTATSTTPQSQSPATSPGGGGTNNKSGNNKLLPGRSVSFRESDMPNYESNQSRTRSAAAGGGGNGPGVVRNRPGSLRTTRTDHQQQQQQQHNRLPPGGGPTNRRSFRMPSRQASIRETRFINSVVSSSSGAAVDEGMHPSSSTSPVAIAQHDATTTTNGGGGGGSMISSSAPAAPGIGARPMIIHRIPIHQAQASHSKYFRSTSLTSDPTVSRGWARSTLSKIMRAKSTTGNDSSASAGFSPFLSRKGNKSAAGGGSSNVSSREDCGKSSAEGSHIDICVMPPTPTASPAASIRSTLSGDSLDRLMTGGCAADGGSGGAVARQQQHLSVRERRRQFARMKGQTIVDGDAAATGTGTAGSSNLDQILTIDTSLLMAGGDHHHIHSSPRCRSASPSSMRHSSPTPSTGRLSPSSLLQVQHHHHHHLLPPMHHHHQAKELMPSSNNSAASLLKTNYEANATTAASSSSSSPSSSNSSKRIQ